MRATAKMYSIITVIYVFSKMHSQLGISRLHFVQITRDVFLQTTVAWGIKFNSIYAFTAAERNGHINENFVSGMPHGGFWRYADGSTL